MGKSETPNSTSETPDPLEQYRNLPEDTVLIVRTEKGMEYVTVGQMLLNPTVYTPVFLPQWLDGDEPQ